MPLMHRISISVQALTPKLNLSPLVKSAMVGTVWANSCPGCMDRRRKHYSHLVGGSFLAGKAAWALRGCMTTKSADYCLLINEWAWSRSPVCLLQPSLASPCACHPVGDPTHLPLSHLFCSVCSMMQPKVHCSV